jgi:hypothetical protein
MSKLTVSDLIEALEKLPPTMAVEYLEFPHWWSEPLEIDELSWYVRDGKLCIGYDAAEDEHGVSIGRYE